ncbi:MAG TPA: hypothetical protein VGK29_13940 [Paludibaculum sp.]
MPDIWRQFRELSRLFFGRFIENDLISVDGDTQGTLVGILGLLAAPGLFIPFFEFLQFGSHPLCWLPWWQRDLFSIPDKVLHLGLSMAVLGVVTVLQWDAILPDRRDYAVLKPLPIGMATMFTAKLWALLRFWAIFTLVLNALSVFLFPLAVTQNSTLPELLWFVRCHALAVLAANGFVFLLMIAIQGVLLNLLGWQRYRRAAPYAQSILVAAILGMFFLAIGVSLQIDPDEPVRGLLGWLPPVWFMGLYEHELGWSQAAFVGLAATAWRALGLTALIGALAYAISYRRSITAAFEQGEGPTSLPTSLRLAIDTALNRWVLRTPAERASFHFVRATILRSRSHRVLVATYAGVGFALVFQSVATMVAYGNRIWWRSPQGPLLPSALVLALFILAGLRYAFSVPAEWRANWAFQIAGGADESGYLVGVRKAVVLLAILPLFTLLLPIHIALWGWRAGAIHIAFGALVAWLLMELILLGMEKVPFTCSYVAGKANLRSSWPLYVAGYLAYVSACAWAEYHIQEQPALLVILVVFVALVKLAVERYRILQAPDFHLRFDEAPEPVVRTLGLQE